MPNDRALLVEAAEPLTSLLFVGDSITCAWADSEALLFRSRGWRCTARAGETTDAISRRLATELDVHRPAQVHIMCGINDIAENAGPYDPERTMRNLTAMMAACTSHGAAYIMATLLPADTVPWRPELEIGSRVRDLVAWQRECCQRSANGMLIDYYAAFLSRKDQEVRTLTIDGIHPNTTGLLLLTETLLANLQVHRP